MGRLFIASYQVISPKDFDEKSIAFIIVGTSGLWADWTTLLPR